MNTNSNSYYIENIKKKVGVDLVMYKIIRSAVLLAAVLLGFCGCGSTTVSVDTGDPTDTVADYTTTFVVEYDANGGSGTAPSDGTAYTEGAEVTVLDKGELTRTDYIFVGWNTSVDGSGTAYSPGDSFTMPASDQTLYAQWEPGFSVVFVPEHQEEIDLSSDSDHEVSQSEWTDVTLTVDGTYDSYQWYVNGEMWLWETANEFQFYSDNFPIGVHTFMVKVEKDGVPFSTSIKIRVVS